MKQILILCAMVLVVASACNKRDVRKSATLNLDFEVEANSDSTLSFSKSALLNVLDNSAIAAIKDDIDHYEIQSIKYSIWELYGNDSCAFTGALRIQKIGNPASEVYYSYNNFGFENPETKIEIPFSESDKKTIEGFLLDQNGLLFKLGGALSHKPIHFVLNVEINVDALAEK